MAAYEAVPFRANDDKYKCLCHQIHCSLGVRLLVVFGFVLTALSILAIPFQNYEWPCLVIHIFFVVLALVALAGLLWASRTEDERFIIPYYVFTALAVLALLALVVLSVWAMISPRSEAGNFYHRHIRNETEDVKTDDRFEDYGQAIQIFAAAVTVVSVVGIALLVWLVLLVAQFYRYLRDIARHPKKRQLVAKDPEHVENAE